MYRAFIIQRDKYDRYGRRIRLEKLKLSSNLSVFSNLTGEESGVSMLLRPPPVAPVTYLSVPKKISYDTFLLTLFLLACNTKIR